MKRICPKPLLICLLSLCVVPLWAANAPLVPDGVKVAAARHFDVFVEKVDTTQVKPGLVLYVFSMTAVVQTQKNGRQLFKRRAESFSADLADPAMWQVGDFDGDGWDDYRFVSAINDKGCRIWSTWRWVPDKERFTLAGKLAWQTDAKGNSVKSCM